MIYLLCYYYTPPTQRCHETFGVDTDDCLFILFLLTWRKKIMKKRLKKFTKLRKLRKFQKFLRKLRG